MAQQATTGFLSLPTPRVIAHRGAAGTNPENTMVSFRAAFEAGAPYFELDVHMTNDGRIVVSHDEDLGRTAGKPGLIRKMTWRDVSIRDAGWAFSLDGRTFPFRDAGVTVPLLEDVLRSFPTNRLLIEVKQVEPSLVAALLEDIDRAAAGRRVFIASEHQEPLDEIRRLDPSIPTNFAYGEVAAFFQAMAEGGAGYRPPAEVVQVPPRYGSWKIVTKDSVEFAHRLGLEVHVWTVNSEEEMAEMLALGVDGIITDFPSRLLQLVNRG